MKYYMIDTLPACMDDNMRVEAWNPETRRVEAAPHLLTHCTLGMDGNYDPVDVEEIDKVQYDKTIKSFGG